HLLCCVSGGADSMALRHFFFFNRGTFGLQEVNACHLNHGLRGQESDAEEDLVRGFCLDNGIGLTVKRIGKEDIPDGNTSEDVLRRIRYDFFEQTADSVSADLIATAHTLNDNAETVIFRLARGTGFRGAAGIPATRGRFIRPLLGCSRQDTEGYCLDNGIPFCTDSSNETDKYSRNMIRHHVIPVLEGLNPRSMEALDSFAALSAETDCFFEEEAAKIIEKDGTEEGVPVTSVLGARPPLDRYIIRRIIGSCCPDPDRQTVNRCLEAARRGGRTELTTGVYFVCSGNKCKAEKEYIPKKIGPVPYESFVPEDREAGFVLSDMDPDGDTLKALFPYCVDYDKLTGVVSVRNRRDGDRFSSAYRKCTKSLKKIFSEKHYSAEKKDSVLILTDDTGIVWVEGEGPAEGRQIGPETKKVLRFHTL
ncbi:MAG: tRNA lysidine(34) synthetase TilS, partial [Oscillospiraceae bacterium]|nr:tRNA lysidine(34) synthetase TilS [Oscillospiraceae bacterium]